MPAGDKKEITIDGQKYVLQRPKVRWTVQHSDRCTDPQGNLIREKYIQGLFDNVVLEPSDLSFDDFDSVTEMRNVVDEIESFL